MSKMGWITGGWEEISFKRVPDGWLFSPPFILLPFIWSRRAYLVTDEQKAFLSRPLRRVSWGTFAAVMVLVVVMASFGPFMRTYGSREYWLVYAALTGVIMFLGWAYLTVAMRPLLAGLVPTRDRITYADRFKRQATTLPTALIIIGMLFSLMLCALGVAMGLSVKWDATAIFCTLFFAILFLYWVVLFVARQKIERSTASTSA